MTASWILFCCCHCPRIFKDLVLIFALHLNADSISSKQKIINFAIHSNIPQWHGYLIYPLFLCFFFFHLHNLISFFSFWFFFPQLKDLNSSNILYKGSLRVEPSPLTLDKEWRLMLVPKLWFFLVGVWKQMVKENMVETSQNIHYKRCER